MSTGRNPDWTTLALVAYRAGAVVYRSYPVSPAARRAPLVILLERQRVFGAESVACYCCPPFDESVQRVRFVQAALAAPPIVPGAVAAVARFDASGEEATPERLIAGVDGPTLENAAPGPLLAVVESSAAAIHWAVAGTSSRGLEPVRLELNAIFERFVLLGDDHQRTHHAI